MNCMFSAHPPHPIGLSILQNAALSSLFKDFSTNRTSQLSTLLGNFVHYWKKLYNTLFCSNKNEPPGDFKFDGGRPGPQLTVQGLIETNWKACLLITNVQMLYTNGVCSFWDWSNSDGGDAGGGWHQLVQTSGFLFQTKILCIHNAHVLYFCSWKIMLSSIDATFCFCPQKIRKAIHQKSKSTSMIWNVVKKK